MLTNDTTRVLIRERRYRQIDANSEWLQVQRKACLLALHVGFGDGDTEARFRVDYGNGQTQISHYDLNRMG